MQISRGMGKHVMFKNLRSSVTVTEVGTEWKVTQDSYHQSVLGPVHAGWQEPIVHIGSNKGSGVKSAIVGTFILCVLTLHLGLFISSASTDHLTTTYNHILRR